MHGKLWIKKNNNNNKQKSFINSNILFDPMNVINDEYTVLDVVL